jgi:hypothetical protein
MRIGRNQKKVQLLLQKWRTIADTRPKCSLVYVCALNVCYWTYAKK